MGSNGAAILVFAPEFDAHISMYPSSRTRDALMVLVLFYSLNNVYVDGSSIFLLKDR